MKIKKLKNFVEDIIFFKTYLFRKEIYIFNNTKNIFEILIKSDFQRNMYQNIGEKIKLNYKKIIISNKKTNNDRKIELNNSILKKIFTNNFQKNK